MSSGGESQNLDPGPIASVATPIMKVLGLMIASQGGALGPGLVGGASLMDEALTTRRERATNAALLQLMQGRQRSETTGGAPGTLSRLPAPLAAETDPEAFARVGTPEVATIPGEPAVPPTRREWTGAPTSTEIMEQLRGMTLPAESLRGDVLREVLRLRLPTDVERPQAVTEELTRARGLEEERRKGGVFTGALRPGAAPEARGAAVAAGMTVPTPPAQTRVQYVGNRKQLIETTTGNVLADEPIRTPEEETQLKQTREVVVPRFEQRLREAVQKKEITAQEAWVGQQLLERAKVDGDVKPFLDHLAKISEIRARPVKPPAARLGTTTTDVGRRPITAYDALKGHQTGVDALTKELAAALPAWKTASGIERAKALQSAYRTRHGVEIAVAPTDASGSSFTLTGAWEPAGERRTRRSYEPAPSDVEAEDAE